VELPRDPFTLAALLLAADPRGLGGAVVLGPGGPEAESWCAFLRESAGGETRPWRRIPAGVTVDRVAGGVDLPETLRRGRRVLLPGIPTQADGGFVVLPSAERVRPDVAALLLEALDRGRLRVERDGISADLPAQVALVALDEARPDEEGSPEALRDRVAFLLTLPPRWAPDGAPDPEGVVRSGARIARVRVAPEVLEALARVSLAGGPGSLRPATFALRAARGIAALRGSDAVDTSDLFLACALVLAPRGVPLPGTPPPELRDDAHAADAADPSPSNEAPDPGVDPGVEPGFEPGAGAPPSETPSEAPRGPAPASLPDRLVEAALALLPAELGRAGEANPARGGRLRGGGRGQGGRPVEAHERGRRVGAEAGPPGRGRRLDLPATLRAAAPWQGLRAREDQGGERTLRVTPADLHVQRRIRPATRRTIFVVDASGSQALRRLSEVKGAVELLLAESYRAREEVALVVFRDREARTLLPPTRSLTRARRLLRGLPGGGGTPLAAGLAEALRLVEGAVREGCAPRVVLLTDGRPNVDASGAGGRTQARADALAVARSLRGHEIRVLDTGLRPEPFLEELARVLGSTSLHLPFADARRIRGALSGWGDG
jgi:magnesium chelatase subunit D